MPLQDTVGNAEVPAAGQFQQVLSLFAVEEGKHSGVGAAETQASSPALQICI